MRKIKIAVVGVGNCASSLIQGIEYYKHRKPADAIGLMHQVQHPNRTAICVELSSASAAARYSRTAAGRHDRTPPDRIAHVRACDDNIHGPAGRGHSWIEQQGAHHDHRTPIRVEHRHRLLGRIAHRVGGACAIGIVDGGNSPARLRGAAIE